VTIPKSKAYITLQGAGRNVTWIEYDMNAASAGSTYDSASVAVFSDHFVARDISFKVRYSKLNQSSDSSLSSFSLQGYLVALADYFHSAI